MTKKKLFFILNNTIPFIQTCTLFSLSESWWMAKLATFWKLSWKWVQGIQATTFGEYWCTPIHSRVNGSPVGATRASLHVLLALFCSVYRAFHVAFLGSPNFHPLFCFLYIIYPAVASPLFFQFIIIIYSFHSFILWLYYNVIIYYIVCSCSQSLWGVFFQGILKSEAQTEALLLKVRGQHSCSLIK